MITAKALFIEKKHSPRIAALMDKEIDVVINK